MCNGDEPIDVEGILFSVSGSGYSCSDWPTTGESLSEPPLPFAQIGPNPVPSDACSTAPFAYRTSRIFQR
jgi:hypothetical protein